MSCCTNPPPYGSAVNLNYSICQPHRFLLQDSTAPVLTRLPVRCMCGTDVWYSSTKKKKKKKDRRCRRLSARCPRIQQSSRVRLWWRQFPFCKWKSWSRCHPSAARAKHERCLRLPPGAEAAAPGISVLFSPFPRVVKRTQAFLYDERWIESLCLSVRECSHLAPWTTWFSCHMAASF